MRESCPSILLSALLCMRLARQGNSPITLLAASRDHWWSWTRWQSGRSDAPASKRECFQRAGEVFGIDAAPFEKLLDVREGRLKPRDIDPELLLASYLKEI